jgi:hypothetical protein
MLICASVTLFSCSKDKDDEDKKSEDNAASYIKFKYNGTAYNISGQLVYFTEPDKNSYTIMGIDMAMNMLTIGVGHNIEEGKTYDIKCGTPDGAPDISIAFTGGLIGDMSFVGPDVEKIGELTITKKTDERLTGTFYCKMLKGDITEGSFSTQFKSNP